MMQLIKIFIPIFVLLILFMAPKTEAITLKLQYDYRNIDSSGISLDESIRILKKALTTKTEDYELHFVLGFTYLYYKKDFINARYEFEKTIKSKPNDYLAYMNLAYSIYSIDNTDKEYLLYMEKALEKALMYAPDKPVIYNALAYAYLVFKKTDKARDILEEGIKKIQDDESLYFNQTLILSGYYKGEESSQKKIIRNMEKAITLSPKEEYYIALGFTYLKEKDYSKARTLFEDALKRHSKSIYLILGLATTYKETNQFEKAIEIAKQALAIEPNNKDVQDEIKEYEEAYKKWKEQNK